MANQTKYFKTPFAESGTRAEVPNNSIGGAVGFDTGFGPDYELPQGSAGRKRIERDKYNGLNHSITKNLKQWQEKLYPTWIEDDGTGVPFSYPVGMIVNHAGQDWISNVSANQEEPGTGNKWSVYFLAKFEQYGTVETLSAGAHPVGSYVEVKNRSRGVFLVQSGGVADGIGVLDAGGGNTAEVQIKDHLNLAWLTSLDGTTANDSAIEWAINNGYQIYLPPKSVTRKTTPTVTDKDIVIISDKGRGAKLANDCDNGVTAFTQNGTDSKIFHLEGFEITNPNLKTNKIANSDLNILSYTLGDLLITDSFDGFFSARQWVSPSFDDVIFRNTNMTAAQLAGAKCIDMEKCNTVDLSKVSLTGAWDYGVHLKNTGGEGNFTVSIGTFTAQGVNDTDKLIGQALWIEGGDAIRVGTLYVEKTREEDCLLIENATGVTFDTCHIVQGSLTLNNCESNLTSVTNYVVSGADPAGLSTIKVIGGRADISNLGNYNDYDFRYEKGDGTGVITGHLKDAVQIPAAVINSGSVGSATAAANTQLVNLGFTGALRITTTAVNSGYKFGIASANLNDGDNFIIAARVRVISGGGKVRSAKIGGSATAQKFPVLHTWATTSEEFQTIFFYGTKTADGASCQFTSDVPCVFDLIVTSYIGW